MRMGNTAFLAVNSIGQITSFMKTKYEEIMQIARGQLAKWKPKLSKKCFEALEEKCAMEWLQSDEERPYEIFRGDMMYEFIANWKE